MGLGLELELDLFAMELRDLYCDHLPCQSHIMQAGSGRGTGRDIGHG
jgi:hypothetical protein